MATVETVKIVFDVDSKELTDTTKELVSLGKVVEDDAAKFKKLNTEAANSEKAFTSLRTQVRQAKDEVQRLAQEGFSEFSQEVQTAKARAGQLADQMSDLNRQVNLLNPEAKARAFVNFGQGVVGAFQVATGALQAFGAENEEVQKIAMRLQGALNVVQGIASIKQLKESYQDVKVVLGVTTAAQNTLNGATAAGGAAAGGAATGFRALTAAMVANPFTAIAVAIGAVVGALILLNDTTDDSVENTEEYKAALGDLTKAQNAAAIAELKLAQARTNDLGEKEKIERQIQSLKNQDEINQLKEKEAAINQKLAEKQNDLIQQQLLLATGDIWGSAFKGIVNFFSGTKDEVAKLEAQSKLVAEEIKVTNQKLATEEVQRREEANKKIEEAKRVSNKKIEEDKSASDKRIADAELKSRQEIQAKFDAARASNAGIEAQRAQEIANQLGEIDKQAALEKDANLATYYGQEKVLRDLDLVTEQQAIDKKLEVLRSFGDTSSDEYQKLLAKQTQLNKEAEDNKTKDTKEGEKERAALREENRKAAEDLLIASADFFFSLQRNNFQKEQDELAAQKEQGIITEEQYQEKLKAIKAKQARADKEQAIFNATIQFAQALINALTTTPANAAPFALAAAATIAGLNLAKIIATPLPKFKEGTLNFQGGSIDGDGGALAVLHPNEAVIPADRNKAYHPTLEAIYKKQIKPSELNAFVLNKLAGKGSIGRDTQITASVDTYALSRAMSRNKGVEVTNAQMIGAAVASELSKRINPRQVI